MDDVATALIAVCFAADHRDRDRLRRTLNPRAGVLSARRLAVAVARLRDPEAGRRFLRHRVRARLWLVGHRAHSGQWASMTRISIRLPDADTDAIDRLVDEGQYETRSAFVAAAVRAALKAERERQVAEAYRRAYTEHPFNENGDEAWILDVGRRALGSQW